MVNPTYKHLEAKLRVSGLALSQWAQLSAAALAALIFGVYLSPLPVFPTIWLSVFVAGLPVALSYGAMGLEFSVSELARAAWHWRHGPLRYLAGPGSKAAGYRVTRSEPSAPPAVLARGPAVGPSEDEWGF